MKKRPRAPMTIRAGPTFFAAHIVLRNFVRIPINFQCHEVMQANHLIPKRRGSRLYFDEKNVVCGCKSFNNWAHWNEDLWQDLWRKLYPDRVEYLELAAKQVHRYKTSDLQLLALHYKQELDRLKGRI